MTERIPKTPPIIKPLSDDIIRPLWSVMIPSYNSIEYLRDTINSVLTQAPSADVMQFDVIDDCSTDGDVEALVNELGKGRIGFFRQPQNVGHYRNFESCINRAKGKLVHILHGDDLVKPGFYEEIKYLFDEYPNIGAAFTNCIAIDENNAPIWSTPQLLDKPGIIDNFLSKSAKELLLQPPSIVVKRSVYEHLGTFYEEHYGEDWVMWTRIAANYDVAYSPKSLANYRYHINDNLTGTAFSTGQNIKGMKHAIDTIQEYLPKSERKSLKNIAKCKYSYYITTGIADRLFHENKNPKVALMQAWAVFKFYPSLGTFYCLFKISVKKFIHYEGKKLVSHLMIIANFNFL